MGSVGILAPPNIKNVLSRFSHRIQHFVDVRHFDQGSVSCRKPCSHLTTEIPDLSLQSTVCCRMLWRAPLAKLVRSLPIEFLFTLQVRQPAYFPLERVFWG